MKLSKFIVLQPLLFFTVLAMIVLLLPCVVLPFWVTKARELENKAKLISQDFNQEILSQVETKSKLLLPLNSSATNLARILSKSVNGTKLPFPRIESEVVPLLFQAFSTVPYLSQVTYIGLDGLLFSYYNKENQQPIAVYSNSSTSFYQKHELICSNISKYTWYSLPVDPETGNPNGEAVPFHPSSCSSQKSTDRYGSLGTAWNDDQDLLFLDTAIMDGIGSVTLGFRVKSLVKFFSGSNGNGGISSSLATKDGEVLGEGMIPNTRMVVNGGNSVSFQLLNSNGDQIGHVGNVPCQPYDGMLRDSILKIWDTKYTVYCSPLQIVGVESFYVLAAPLKGPQSFEYNKFDVAFVLLLIMITSMFVSVIIFVLLIAYGGRTELQLRAELIKQKEATQQAERKSLNKSNAFASASHDVRTSLAGLTGLIDICRHEVAPGSELEANLEQMKSCSQDLLGILNSILDASKIEAGKIDIEEEEFDVAQLVEDVADLFHSVGMKKGVDVVLDLHDGSVTKFSRVKGDRGKLKQILCNLVSNAVKFTQEGHVSIRAFARKPTIKNSRLASARNKPLTWLGSLLFKNDEPYDNIEAMNAVQQDENCMEFIFEVDDTGKGIPKEKAKLVFENYVQVKETALGQEGTGLGLAIVQSLVRLMGGDIVIADKDIGQKGTCFRFNTYLTVIGTDNMAGNVLREYDIESLGSYKSSESYGHFSRTSSRINSPRVNRSQVVLFLSGERLKVSKKFMQKLGIKVSAVKSCEHLSTTLKKIKQKLLLLQHTSPRRSEASNSSTPVHTRPYNYTSPSDLILIVIDTSDGPFRELCRAVAEFRKDLFNVCIRVVWIDKPGAHNIHSQGLDEEKLPPTDIIISKPFHGSRLYQVISFLPEFGGTMPAVPVPPARNEDRRTKWSAGATTSSAQISPNTIKSSSAQNLPTPRGEIEVVGGPSNEKPLNGKKVLVAEDDLVLQKIATSVISRLGATVEICGNGKEALETVCRALSNQRNRGAPYVLPYDYIFMDCEMPIMDGFEATRCIREEEKNYGVHIPIIAVSAHTDGPEIQMMKQAGMDHHLPKPLNPAKLQQVIKDIHGL